MSVDLTERYLSEDDWDRIKDRVPSGCPTCGDATVYTDLSGTQMMCKCREQKFLMKHYLAAGIGELYMRLDWDDYQGEEGPVGAVNDYLNACHAFVREGLGFTFTGTFGSGKTMLAMLAAKRLVREGYSVYATTYSEMIEMFSAGWRDRADQLWFERKIINSKILVLDDIGKEMLTKLSESTFDHVIRQRIANLRPTIITTNLTEKEIPNRYGAGALSILFERSVVREFTGADFRRKARVRAIAEAKEGRRRPIV